METRLIRVDLDKSADHFSLVCVGDMHIGSVNCDEDKIARDISRIAKSQTTRAIVIGDIIEGINTSDPRFDFKSLAPQFRNCDITNLSQLQAEAAAELLTPITEHADGFLIGNHEDVVFRKYHYDPMVDMLARLYPGDKYQQHRRNWKYGCVARYKVTKGGMPALDFEVYATHGTGSSSTKEGALKKCKKLAEVVDVDVYMCGHHHKRIHDSETQLRVKWNGNGGRVGHRRKGFVSTGAYMKTYLDGYAGYGERRTYAPVEIGSTVIDFDLDANTFDISNY